MKKVTFIAVAAIIAFPLFANTPSDTTIVLGNKKIEIIDEENRLRVRVFDLIEYGEHVERQLAFEGHYRDGVRHERRHINVAVPTTVTITSPNRDRRRQPHFQPRWEGFGIGFNHFANDDFSINAMRSLEYSMNIVHKGIPFSSSFGLVSGFGLTWNRFHLNENMLFANVDGITMVVPADEGINLTRSRLGINSITFPLLLQQQIRMSHNRRSLYLSAGAVGNINYMSRVKINYRDVQGRRVNETIRGRDLHVRPLTIDLKAMIGVNDWFAVYAKYRPMGLFERDRGPVINPVLVGIMAYF